MIDLVTADRPSRVLFLGVSTSASAIHAVFPGWAVALDVDLGVEGVDLPIGSPPAAYSALLDRIRNEPRIAGMVVTTHKAALWSACAACFDRVTDLAAMLGEVGGLSRMGRLLVADAPDARSVGSVAQKLLANEHWLEGKREVVILGGGGAGLSLAYNLCDRLDEIGARSVALIDVDPERVEVVRELARDWRRASILAVHVAASGVSDRLVSEAGAGALIVNASGLGKDRPGSPLGGDTALPPRSIYWDFNYRGDLPLLRQARDQAAASDLLVVDGRDYFVCGWLEALCFVLQREPSEELLVQFDRAAQAAGV